MSEKSLMPITDTPKEVSTISTLMPYRKDDDRAKYLGYLACGFSDEEALYVLGLNRAWLDQNRSDELFSAIEIKIPDSRKEIAKEYAELDFYRNFRMVLEKDHRVLRRSLDMDVDEDGDIIPLSPFDQQYLLKLRSAYTPQQLQLLQVVVGEKSEGFNFADWVSKNQEVISMSRTDTLTVRKAIGTQKDDNS